MSRFDDEEHRAAFTEATDFEGGQWMGGEFYYEKQLRNRKKQSKEDTIYGIFGGDSSDEEERSSKRRKGKGGALGKDYSRPVGFVSGGVKTAEELYKAEDKQDVDMQDDEEEEAERPRGGLGFGSSRSGQKESAVDKEKEKDIVEEEDLTGQKFRELLQAGGGGRSGRASLESDMGQSNATFAAMVNKNGKDGAGADMRRKAMPRDYRRELGHWQKHTKGVGLKILEKFGFKGRLGKDESGIVKPIEVKVRPGTMGMGYGNFKEANQLKANRELEEDVFGRKPGEEAEAEKQKERERKKKDAESRWRRDQAARRPKRVYKTAEELLEEQVGPTGAPVPSQKQVIIDMRGERARLLSNFDSLAAPEDEAEEEASLPKLGQELEHNVRMLVDMTEISIYSLDKKIRQQEEEAETLAEEHRALEVRLRREEEQLQRVEKVHAIVQRLKKAGAGAAEGSGDALSAEELAGLFETLRSDFAEEFELFRLAELASSVVFPVLRAQLSRWSPLEDPYALVESLATWKRILAPADGVSPLTFSSSSSSTSSSATSSSLSSSPWSSYPSGGGVLSSSPDGDPAAAYEQLVHAVALPQVRSALVNAWDVRDPSRALQLVEVLSGLVSSRVLHQSVLQPLVLPKLRAGVQRWDPMTDPVHLHAWLLPWRSLLSSELSELYPHVRQTLAAVLQQWHPSDATALAVLQPWAEVWPPDSMEALLLRCVMPKLVAALREMQVHPGQQQIEPLLWALRWQGLLPDQHLAALLEGEFFPKWIAALYQWLCGGPDTDHQEVMQWYLGWKNAMPPQLLALDSVRAQFSLGLELMQMMLQGNIQAGAALIAPYANLSYGALLRQRRDQGQGEAQWPPPYAAPGIPPPPPGVPPPPPGVPPPPPPLPPPQQSRERAAARAAAAAALSFKDVVEAFAAEHDLTFLPDLKAQRHQGKQLYLFGDVRCYIDQGVVWAQDTKTNASQATSFSPISLDDLLARVRRGSR